MKLGKVGKFLAVFCLVAIVFLAIPVFSQTEFASAEDFYGETIQDQNDNFSVTMSALSRQRTLLARDEQMDETETVTYLCFKWRDLLRLNFHFIATPNPETRFGNCEFRVVHVAKDTLTPILNNTHETLYKGLIDDFKNMEFRYFIDTTFEEANTTTNSAGHGFGLYKFDFVYEYWNSAGEKFEPISLGKSFYVAVLLDTNVEELVKNTELSIVFNLALSKDVLKYVRPDLVVWVAYGTSTENVNCCLTEEMKKFDEKLIGDFVVYDEYPQSIYGPTFKLQTKDIEGIWSAKCIIRNTGGDVILSLQTSNLSTVKVPPKDYVWLILLILGILLLILLIISFIIIRRMKKSEKVW